MPLLPLTEWPVIVARLEGETDVLPETVPGRPDAA